MNDAACNLHASALEAIEFATRVNHPFEDDEHREVMH